MNCVVVGCDGLVNDLKCSAHGELCSECQIPTMHIRPDKKCGRCGARANGEVCADCTSPWVYLRYYEDGRWRCRMCTINLIDRLGFEESASEIAARFAEMQARIDREREEREAAARAATEEAKAARIRRRTKVEQEENLFTLGDAKKKRKRK